MKLSIPYLLLIFLIKISCLHAQQDAFKGPRKDTLNDFNQLKVYSGIIVNLIPADENKAIIYGDRYGGIRLIQKGNTLKLRMRLGELFYYNNAYVDLYYKTTLHTIKLHQGAVLYTEKPLTQANLLLKVHEGARFEGEITTEKLTTKIRTGGIVSLNGSTSEHIIKVSTGGICEANKLVSKRTQVRVFAGGDVGIFSNERVEAHVSMGGNIGIKGNPKSVIARRTIAGEI